MKNNLKLLFVSLGCDKNLVDTEFMLGMLRDDGIEMTDDEQEADIIIVNTCCFINDAKEESINTILEMAELKKEARLKSLIVTGCLAQRYKEEIVKACEICKALGVAFVKTSTGFNKGGATVEDVALMKKTVGNIGVKASGGIRDTQTALAMIKAGATRIGASAGIAIVTGVSANTSSNY